jgi:hypothetical protein
MSPLACMNRKTRTAFHINFEAVRRMPDERRSGRAKSWAVNFMSDLKLFRLSSGGVAISPLPQP